MSKNNSTEDEISNDDEELSFDEDELEYLNSFDDNTLEVLLKFGYIVEVNGSKDIRLEVTDEKVIDEGLIAGITQNEKFVDAYFLGNNFMKDNGVKFEKDYIIANEKKYKYDELRIDIDNQDAYVVSDVDDYKIVKLDEEAYIMFASILNESPENNIVLSVVDSQVSACFISNGDIEFVTPFDLGKNKFDEEKEVINVSGMEIELSNCYIRTCNKYIYLHCDLEELNRTLIIGKTENPFYSANNFYHEV